MTFKKSLFQGSKRRGFSEEQICTFINKAGYKVPANFCYETKKAKTSNTGHASQLMTTDYLASHQSFEEDSDG
jgi:hypothetical protein